MREKIIKNRKYILITLAFLLALAFNIGMRYLAARPRYKTLPEVRLRNQKETSTKGFAIMVQSGNDYVEYEGDTWPGEGYKFREVKCVDNNGELVENAAIFKDGILELQTASTVYCTLYFDTGRSTIEILREKDTSHYLSEDLPGGMYRYQASFPECYNESVCENATKMTNWICFGTDNKEECTDTTDSDSNGVSDGIDKYMYRIIGITKQGQLYLIKETFLKEGSTQTFAWSDKDLVVESKYGCRCNHDVCPEWDESDLFKRINGISNGLSAGSGGYSAGRCSVADTDIFIDSSEYDYLKSGDGKNGTDTASGWYNLIENHEWMYGDTIGGWGGLFNDYYNGDTMYNIETGVRETAVFSGTRNNVKQIPYIWPKTNRVRAKIGLMYIHDFIYSYFNGHDVTRDGWPASAGELQTAWLGLDSAFLFMTRYGLNSAGAGVLIIVYDSDRINTFGLSTAYHVKPVFYLSSKAKIVDGDGTKNSPYILSGI